MRTSVLPEGVELEGNVAGSGDLVVRGTLIGNVDLEGVLTVDVGGIVRGEVRVRGMLVRGLVEGPVTALELLKLENGARVVGDVQADRVSAATGAVLRGRVRMTGADRLRRTVGGTLTAPFTSSGSVEAPLVRGETRSESGRGESVARPLDPTRLSTLSAAPHPSESRHDGARPNRNSIRERLTEMPDESRSIPLRHDIRSRVTEPPETRGAAMSFRQPAPFVPVAPTQQRNPASRSESRVEASRPEASRAEASRAEASRAEVGLTAPPPPVIPRIGRVKSRRREEPSG